MEAWVLLARRPRASTTVAAAMAGTPGIRCQCLNGTRAEGAHTNCLLTGFEAVLVEAQALRHLPTANNSGNERDGGSSQERYR